MRLQIKDAPFGNVNHLLTLHSGKPPIEANLLNLMNKLLDSSLLGDIESPLSDIDLQSSGGQGTTKDDSSGILNEIDKTTHTGEYVRKIAQLGDIHIPLSIHLGK